MSQIRSALNALGLVVLVVLALHAAPFLVAMFYELARFAARPAGGGMTGSPWDLLP